MTNTLTIDMDAFKRGLQLLDDDSKAPFGSARKMYNVLISDRGGIQNRPGTLLIGTKNTAAFASRGFFDFQKAHGATKIMLHAYDTSLKFFDDLNNDWYLLKEGFTSDKEFGFAAHIVTTENEDFVYFCNRFEDYQRWQGNITHLNGALVGGETDVTVDSTLKSDVYASKTATANSATTVDVSGTPWATSQWINFYVLITSGAKTGKVRKITASTSNQITFDTLGGGPGNCTFEIRQLAFPATGTLIYNSITIAYTGIDTSTTFQVTSAHGAADNTPVTHVPILYPADPRGNRIEPYLGRMVVGRIRSALSRDSSGNLQGSAAESSVFVSKQKNATDFTFAAIRIAGEGDLLNVPYGSGITDVKATDEGNLIIYSTAYMEAVKYSQDNDDFAVRQQIKSGIGSIAKVIRGSDDHYFFTVDRQFTSLGRVAAKDSTPQTQNIGLVIKRLLDTYDPSSADGIEYKNRVISTLKTSEDENANNVMVLWNKKTESFEGIWNLSAFGFTKRPNALYYANSVRPNIYQMFTGKADVEGLNRFAITSEWVSNFFNVLPVKGNIQGINSVAMEGFITANTTYTFSLYSDRSTTAALQFDFSGTEDDFITGSITNASLGGFTLALQPLGTFSDPDEDGRRYFSFEVFFPYTYSQYFSVGLASSGKDFDWEVIRISLGLKEEISGRLLSIKTL
jgi:hypothetical protein